MSYSSKYDDYARSRGNYYLNGKFLRETPWGLRNLIREKLVLQLIEIDKAEKVLDSGCASGHTLFELSQSHPGSTFLGIDIGKEFISVADKHVSKLELNNIKFEHTSIEDFRTENHFDKILLLEVLEHVLDEKNLLLKLKNLLAKNGEIIITTPNLNGDGTLYGRFLRALKLKKFTPAIDFSSEGTLIHGDQHVREFNSKSLENLMASYGFKSIFSSGVICINFPFQDFMHKILRRIPGVLLMIEKVEIFTGLYLRKFSKKLGRHLVYVFVIGD